MENTNKQLWIIIKVIIDEHALGNIIDIIEVIDIRYYNDNDKEIKMIQIMMRWY